AAWGVLILTQSLGAAGVALGNSDTAATALAHPDAFAAVGLNLPGLTAISQGFLITCTVWAAASVGLIERRFALAALWMLVGAVAAFFGFIHAGHSSPAGGLYDIGWATGWRWSLGYALCAGFFALMHLWARKHPAVGRPEEGGMAG